MLAQAVLPLEPEEVIEAIVDTRDYETSKFLVMITKMGQVKKTPFLEYDSRNSTLVAINLSEGDEVVAVRQTSGEEEMLSSPGLGRASASRKATCGRWVVPLRVSVASSSRRGIRCVCGSQRRCR